MADAAGPKTLKAGEYLFLQGQEGNELYFLKSGKLEVLLSPAKANLTEEEVNKNGQVIETFDQPGQLIGEISPILNCPRTASIRAAGDCALQAADMRPGVFENVMKVKPALGIKIAEELARRINKTNDRVKKEDMRLLRFLEELRVALSSFEDSHGAALDITAPALSGNLFLSLSKLAGALTTLPPDLPVSLALPYEEAESFFAFFGGIAFQTAGPQTASAAAALAKVQGKKYSAGEMLCTSGEEARELFILLQGRLNVVVGRRTIQTIEGRGNMVGEMAFLLKTRRTASVVAVEPSMVLAVPFDKMEPLFQKVPQLLLLMLKQLAGRLLQIDTLLQKSTWRNLFFGEILPNFSKTIRASSEGLPESLDEGARTAAQKAVAMIDESVAMMSKMAAAAASEVPFTLAELVSDGGAPQETAVDAERLHDTPPGPESHQEHTDFVLALADNRRVFGPPRTPKSRFAQFLNVEPAGLVMGRIVGKLNQPGTYAEILLDEDGTNESRLKMAEQIAMALGISYFLFTKTPTRWLYKVQTGGGSGAVAADAIPRAEQMIEVLSKLERASMTPLDKSRARRLYLEALTTIFESHWSSPGQFTELTPAEQALIQFGAVGDQAADRTKLDAPPGRTQVSVVDFAKKVVVGLAGGASAVMGSTESAKVQMPEVEKQITELLEARKKTYADLQIAYEDSREGPLLQGLEKMTQLSRLKEKGALPANALRDFASAEKDTEKMFDERNGFITQNQKGEPGRKSVAQIKAVEDQIRAAQRQKLDLLDIIQMPQAEAEAKKEKDSASLLPVNLLNGFRDLLSDLFTRIRQSLQQDNLDVVPIFTEGVRLYSTRDVGIGFQKIFEKDKLLASAADFPPILRLPGGGYSIYSEEWKTLVVPLYIIVDPFQMMANGVGEWRWSKLPDSERKKYQKALKGGSSIKMDQLGLFFSREYRLLLDDKDVDEGSTKFIQGVLTTPLSAPAAAAPAAKAK